MNGSSVLMLYLLSHHIAARGQGTRSGEWKREILFEFPLRCLGGQWRAGALEHTRNGLILG